MLLYISYHVEHHPVLHKEEFCQVFESKDSLFSSHLGIFSYQIVILSLVASRELRVLPDPDSGSKERRPVTF